MNTPPLTPQGCACTQPADHYTYSQDRDSALLPFDTLLLDMPPEWRLLFARRHAAASVRRTPPFTPQWPAPLPPTPTLATTITTTTAGVLGHRLRLGYMTYDYNDHPTAHLVEGLFAHHDRSKVHVTAYSYGKGRSTDRVGRPTFLCSVDSLALHWACQMMALPIASGSPAWLMCL